jgi:hypothetical protein
MELANRNPSFDDAIVLILADADAKTFFFYGKVW